MDGARDCRAHPGYNPRRVNPSHVPERGPAVSGWSRCAAKEATHRALRLLRGACGQASRRGVGGGRWPQLGSNATPMIDDRFIASDRGFGRLRHGGVADTLGPALTSSTRRHWSLWAAVRTSCSGSPVCGRQPWAMAWFWRRACCSDYAVLAWLFPTMFHDYWNLDRLSGAFVGKVPAEELGWAFCWGFFAGPMFPFLAGSRAGAADRSLPRRAPVLSGDQHSEA